MSLSPRLKKEVRDLISLNEDLEPVLMEVDVI